MRWAILALLLCPALASAQGMKAPRPEGRWLANEPARTNIILESSTFDSGTWGKFPNVAATPNTTVAPNGSQTADTLVTAVAASPPAMNQTVTIPTAGVYTFSIWLKAGTQSVAIIGLNNGPWPNATGRVLAGSCAVASVVVGIPMGVSGLSSAWCRVAYTATLAAGAYNQYIYIETNGTSTAGASIIAWGAQLEAGPIATRNVTTTTAAVSHSARPWR